MNLHQVKFDANLDKKMLLYFTNKYTIQDDVKGI